MAPLITIIIPTYNRKQLLEKAILSVINQKQDNPFDRELIIVDDGSNDGTKEYMQQYVDKYKNIFYFYQENSGVGSARNIGISHMSKNSDYTIFLDSDDELINDIISILLSKTKQLVKKRQDKNILGCYFLCVDELGNLLGNKSIFKGKNEVLLTYDTYLTGAIDREFLLIIKSSVLTENSDLRFPEDVITEGVLWSRMWKYSYKIDAAFILYDTIGRMYRTTSSMGQKKITKTIDHKKFVKNALGNEYILKIIGNDLLYRGLRKKYGELLFRAGINRILSGEKKKGLKKLKESLIYNRSLVYIVAYTMAYIHKNIILFLYRLYI